jgi:uncharacterized integral membrane protein (TIGR00698 family)
LFVNSNLKKYLFYLILFFLLFPFVNTALALVLGVFFSLVLGNPFKKVTSKLSSQILMYSIVGLGAGINLNKALQVGLAGFVYTVLSISITLLLGYYIGKFLKLDKEINYLISFGTAICGGSAIAALSPVVKAKPQSVAISLATVFLLNSIALITFPFLGHLFGLTQQQFGLWAALAIHDTSSVVGASMQYGAEALSVGTTVKLVRALWIVPVTFLFGLYINRKAEEGDRKAGIKKPWFILGFLIFAAVFTWVPELSVVGKYVDIISKKALVVTLFLIGANLSLIDIKQAGLRPLAQGIILWILVASGSLFLIFNGYIN